MNLEARSSCSNAFRSRGIQAAAGAVLVSAAFLVTAISGRARDSDAMRTFQEQAAASFLEAVQGDGESLEGLLALCRKAMKDDELSALALAWHGTGIVFKCGGYFEQGDMATGMKLWNQGLKELDDAVQQAPDDPWVRLRRGQTLLDVWQYDPMTGEAMAKKAARDVAAAVDALGASLDGVPRSTRLDLFYKLGLAWDKVGEKQEADASMQRVIDLGKGTPAEGRAREWLEEKRGSASSASPPERSYGDVERFDLLVRDDFFAALDGDKERFEKAMKICEQALRENPENAGALCWHGFGLLIRAGWQREDTDEAGVPAKKSDLWTRGLEELHRATALEPENVGPLLVRGSTFLNVTRSPNISEDVRSLMLWLGIYDSEKVLRLQEEQGYFQYLTPHARGEILMGLADGWHRVGNWDRAKIYFERISRDIPETTYARDAGRYLRGEGLEELESRSCTGCHEQD